MALLSRADIKALKDDLESREVDVPEWGGSVFVRTMAGDELNAFQEEQQHNKGSLHGLMARLLVRCLCEGTGERLFKDHEAGELGKRSAKALKRLFDVAAELNGLGDDDVEDMAKN